MNDDILQLKTNLYFNEDVITLFNLRKELGKDTSDLEKRFTNGEILITNITTCLSNELNIGKRLTKRKKTLLFIKAKEISNIINYIRIVINTNIYLERDITSLLNHLSHLTISLNLIKQK